MSKRLMLCWVVTWLAVVAVACNSCNKSSDGDGDADGGVDGDSDGDADGDADPECDPECDEDECMECEEGECVFACEENEVCESGDCEVPPCDPVAH